MPSLLLEFLLRNLLFYWGLCFYLWLVTFNILSLFFIFLTIIDIGFFFPNLACLVFCVWVTLFFSRPETFSAVILLNILFMLLVCTCHHSSTSMSFRFGLLMVSQSSFMFCSYFLYFCIIYLIPPLYLQSLILSF
jgi:hypothetical protein